MLQQHLEEKEISSLCWASSDGSVLAVGYVDGDILLWTTPVATTNKSQRLQSSNNIVKLQLSSAEKRLPIIELHWWENDKSRHDGEGQLLIYGGYEIGADEVVTILSLEWAPGKQNLECLTCEVLKLDGSFADAVLLPNSAKTGSYSDPAVCILTSPGKLQLFDSFDTSASAPRKERNIFVSTIDFPVVIPTMSPSMTVARLFCLPADGSSLKSLSKILAVKKLRSSSNLTDNVKKRAIAGGVLNHFPLNKDRIIEKLYVTGYQDASVWLWDATFPVLSLMCVIDSERIKSLDIAGSHSPVSAVDLCFQTLRLAVGVESGLVFLYSLNVGEKTNFHLITGISDEVQSLPQAEGPTYEAVFSILNSRVQVLQFSNSGAKLIVGYECARIAVLDTKSLKIVILTDNLSGCSQPLVTVVWKEFSHNLDNDLSHTGPKTPDSPVEDCIFILTEDTRVQIICGNSGNVIRMKPLQLRKRSAAVSMYIIDGSSRTIRIKNENLEEQSSNEDVVQGMSLQDKTASRSLKSKADNDLSVNLSPEGAKYSYFVLCCKNAVHVFSMQSVLQGYSKSISKIKFAKPCCWTTMFMKDEKTYGLLLLFQTGEIEIRSLPHLKLVKDVSLMSTLRWNFKAGMDKTISSTKNGLITLVLGSEVAFISVLARENQYRIPECLPSLHDEVLAAAVKSGLNVSSINKKKQVIGSGFLGGMVKGLKAGKLKNSFDCSFSHLEGIFSKRPFQDAAPTSTAHDLRDNDLSIDDIEIDEPVPRTSSHFAQDNGQEIKSEREKLLEGGSDSKPRVRTREEIIAAYRKTGDASSAAGEARNKLLERQEKLERISKRTEELQSEAEDFASLANELVKVMEKRKWWHM
ncbi:hypothetical protein Leryth_000073 [Lithospermum erythrorhizon]|nr:hypothetical protein Leryth_000073 [Lithospermum erythrorhizon]